MFLSQFRASVAYAPSANTLANIKQKDNETLNEYLKCFNDEVPKVRKASEETYKNFLIAGVKPGTDFWKELQRRELRTLAAFYAKAEPHKVVEELLAKLKRDNNPGGSRNWGKNKRNRSYSPKGRGCARRTSYRTTLYSGNQANGSEKNDKKAPITVNTADSQRSVDYKYPSKREAARYTEYTPLTASIGHILEVGDKNVNFYKPARNGPPGRKDMARNCAFHDANGHEMAECRHLKDHIKDLIRKRFLTEFVAKEAKRYKDDKACKEGEKGNPDRPARVKSIHTIIEGLNIGGSSRNAMKNYAHEARGPILTNVYNLSERPPKYFKGESADITFIEADTRHVHHPHNDALVVNAIIGGTNVYRMLVDNGSSVKILTYSTYHKMGLLDKELLPCYNNVYGFTGNPVLVVGKIKFPVTLGEEPLTAT
ncbi:uncharacterized protein LOC141702719 [Apium graveolens]|uniref:uncharacterized protein LOC141702719 n=1 Tax=Apium graveolens TaxID=4045 RepID=UPI003D7BA550